jgi:hypothetical protein
MDFKMKWRIVAGIIIIVVIILSYVIYSQSLKGPLFHTTYKIEEEISGFPVSEMSFTVCNMATSKTVSLPDSMYMTPLGEENHYVILTIAIRNIANHELFFNRSDPFMGELREATAINYFFLTIGTENHEVEANRLSISAYNSQDAMKSLNSYAHGWGVIMEPTPLVKYLSPNQTVYGKLYCTISDYASVNELVWREVGMTQKNLSSLLI